MGVPPTKFKERGLSLPAAVAIITPPLESSSHSGGSSSNSLVVVPPGGGAAAVIAQHIAPAAPGSTDGCELGSGREIYTVQADGGGSRLLRFIIEAGSGCCVAASAVDAATGEALQLAQPINRRTLVVAGNGAPVGALTALTRMEPGIGATFSSPAGWEDGSDGSRQLRPPAGGAWLPQELLPQPLQSGRQQPAIAYFASGLAVMAYCQPFAGSPRQERALVCISSGTSQRGIGLATLVFGRGAGAARQREGNEWLRADGKAAAAEEQEGEGRVLRLAGSGGMGVLDQQGNFYPGKLVELWGVG